MKKFSFILYIFILLSQHNNFAYTAKLRLYCGNIENYESTELDMSLSLLKSKCFKANRKTIIYAFGFITTPESPSAKLLVQSYLTLKQYNVFMIDWEKEVSTITGTYEPVEYALIAVPNAKKVGKICGQALHNMSESTLNLDTTHLIGHSLGAQMLGFCGQELQKFNKNISRITGLDPSGLLFDLLVPRNGLNRSRATFVDILHTNPGFLGTNKQIGHVDIWFNCNATAQPNCANKLLLEKEACNHFSSIEFYVQAVLNATAFLAQSSKSCYHWQSMAYNSQSSDVIQVGETTDHRARGNFYLTTSPQFPYGKGKDGLLSTQS